jgi:hypothetical protein
MTTSDVGSSDAAVGTAHVKTWDVVSGGQFQSSAYRWERVPTVRGWFHSVLFMKGDT